MKKGFTLIEVCLVMMIFGVAVSSLLAIFPVSLRQGNAAVADSVVSMFADYVLNSLAANASSDAMKDWSKWNDEAKFRKAIVAGIQIDTGGGPSSGPSLATSGSVDEYLGIEKSFIKYQLSLDPVSSPFNYDKRLWRATLYVTDNKMARTDDDMKRTGICFVTYFTYLGEAPQ